MVTRHEKYDSGWVGISFSFSHEEIDSLINRLSELKSGKIGHFHFRTDDFSGREGITDVELSIKGIDEKDNMSVE